LEGEIGEYYMKKANEIYGKETIREQEIHTKKNRYKHGYKGGKTHINSLSNSFTLHNSYHTANIIKMIKLRMTCSMHGRVVKTFGSEPEERDHQKDIGVYGRIILNWIIKKQDEWARTGFIWLRKQTIGELLCVQQ
jgi:hypothetical protein